LHDDVSSAATAKTAYEAGRQAWPGVSLSSARFLARAAAADIAPDRLTQKSADIFLAFACADGDPRAIQLFEREILSQIDLYVARFALSKHALDEVRQRVRVKLLVGGSPAIGRYRGYGTLAAWVRITAVRVAIDVAGTASSRQLADVDVLELGVSLDESPELATARSLYRDRLRAALEASLRDLAPRDRTLLRLFVVDGLNIEAIGLIYKVHRATIARWFVAMRARVFQSVRDKLGLQRQPSPSEMWSLIGLLQDDIQISARRVLAASQSAAAPR
jgi:RNA polymerase sigma-70 factor, ECF subfamily